MLTNQLSVPRRQVQAGITRLSAPPFTSQQCRVRLRKPGIILSKETTVQSCYSKGASHLFRVAAAVHTRIKTYPIEQLPRISTKHQNANLTWLHHQLGLGLVILISRANQCPWEFKKRDVDVISHTISLA